MMYFQRLGDVQAKDRLVYARPDEPDWSFGVGPTDDGEYLVLSIFAWHRPAEPGLRAPRRRFAADRRRDRRLDRARSAISRISSRKLAMKATKFFFADRSRCADEAHREHGHRQTGPRACHRNRAGREVDARRGQPTQRARHYSVPARRVDAGARVRSGRQADSRCARCRGSDRRRGLAAIRTTPRPFTLFRATTRPGSIYRYDVPSGESKLVRRSKVKFDPEQYAVEQVFYTSKDGTRVPMMLAYRKDLARDKPQPTLLYGYGGFNISIPPHFSPDYAVWMEMGGVLAVANLRGGGEYGEDWHQAGKTLKKQNVFDDFIAAAERLIADGRTSRERLAINGGSNGGLLVGAVDGAAARVVRGVHPGGRRDGHAPLPPVHGRPVLADRIRLGRRSRISSKRSSPIRRITTSRTAPSIRPR